MTASACEIWTASSLLCHLSSRPVASLEGATIKFWIYPTNFYLLARTTENKDQSSANFVAHFDISPHLFRIITITRLHNNIATHLRTSSSTTPNTNKKMSRGGRGGGGGGSRLNGIPFDVDPTLEEQMNAFRDSERDDEDDWTKTLYPVCDDIYEPFFSSAIRSSQTAYLSCHRP